MAATDLGPRLFRYFLIVFPRPMAADLTQDTLLRLIQFYQNGKFDPGKGTLAMLAFGLARNIKKEAFNRIEKDIQLRILSAQETNLATPAVTDEEFQDLRQAIQRLPENERNVVELLIDKDLTIAEIGEILDMPPGTVKSHVHRAKQSLKNILAKNRQGADYERT